MRIVETVDLPEDVCDYVQFLLIEKDSYKEILSHILLLRDKQGYEYSKDNYTHFMTEFREANIKYNQTINSVIKTYASDYFGNNNYKVEFIFDDFIMHVIQINGDACE